jgi:hypothetical protein
LQRGARRQNEFARLEFQRARRREKIQKFHFSGWLFVSNAFA